MVTRKAERRPPTRILFDIPIAVVLMLIIPSAAFAWGVGGGGASVPAFGALWQAPSAPGQDVKKGSKGGSVHHKAKKKAWRSGDVSR
jgi:hypothetical protein